MCFFYSEFAFHPRLTPSLDCTRESFNTGELTARLIAWRDQNCQRRSENKVNLSETKAFSLFSNHSKLSFLSIRLLAKGPKEENRSLFYLQR